MEDKICIQTFKFTADDVRLFSEVSQDKNPIHLDPNYASKTIFKKPIIHGFLGASIFSKIIGMDFPGNGTIYLKQDLKFLAPMYVDTEYIAKIQVREIYSEKGRALLYTTISNKSGEMVISGEALVQHERFE